MWDLNLLNTTIVTVWRVTILNFDALVLYLPVNHKGLFLPTEPFLSYTMWTLPILTSRWHGKWGREHLSEAEPLLQGSSLPCLLFPTFLGDYSRSCTLVGQRPLSLMLHGVGQWITLIIRKLCWSMHRRAYRRVEYRPSLLHSTRAHQPRDCRRLALAVVFVTCMNHTCSMYVTVTIYFLERRNNILMQVVSNGCVCMIS